MTSRTVREASGLQSLTSTLYLRLRKADRDASFHCSVSYHLPAGRRGRLDSPAFHLTLHCESLRVLPSPTLDPPSPPAAPPRPRSEPRGVSRLNVPHTLTPNGVLESHPDLSPALTSDP